MAVELSLILEHIRTVSEESEGPIAAIAKSKLIISQFLQSVVTVRDPYMKRQFSLA